MTQVSRTQLETFAERFVADIAATAAPGRAGATVVALVGDLGAGKTTFTQALARALGVTGPITSPTFVIEQVYDLPRDKDKQGELYPFTRLVHIDAYRLESADELARLGWSDVIADPNNLVVVEWGEKVREILPATTIWLEFTVTGESERSIKRVTSNS
ncbi:MAG: tRNA (adenosine(37)-N6)-threonylcarbamoyltransferase complex ATPase subunit type 1 TsaE [Candidatus Paceibacterota bacterium]